MINNISKFSIIFLCIYCNTISTRTYMISPNQNNINTTSPKNIKQSTSPTNVNMTPLSLPNLSTNLYSSFIFTPDQTQTLNYVLVPLENISPNYTLDQSYQNLNFNYNNIIQTQPFDIQTSSSILNPKNNIIAKSNIDKQQLQINKLITPIDEKYKNITLNHHSRLIEMGIDMNKVFKTLDQNEYEINRLKKEIKRLQNNKKRTNYKTKRIKNRKIKKWKIKQSNEYSSNSIGYSSFTSSSKNNSTNEDSNKSNLISSEMIDSERSILSPNSSKNNSSNSIEDNDPEFIDKADSDMSSNNEMIINHLVISGDELNNDEKLKEIDNLSISSKIKVQTSLDIINDSDDFEEVNTSIKNYKNEIELPPLPPTNDIHKQNNNFNNKSNIKQNKKSKSRSKRHKNKNINNTEQQTKKISLKLKNEEITKTTNKQKKRKNKKASKQKLSLKSKNKRKSRSKNKTKLIKTNWDSCTKDEKQIDKSLVNCNSKFIELKDMIKNYRTKKNCSINVSTEENFEIKYDLEAFKLYSELLHDISEKENRVKIKDYINKSLGEVFIKILDRLYIKTRLFQKLFKMNSKNKLKKFCIEDLYIEILKCQKSQIKTFLTEMKHYLTYFYKKKQDYNISKNRFRLIKSELNEKYFSLDSDEQKILKGITKLSCFAEYFKD
ncbi:MAG: hypothetical protein GY830_05975 [Bacteroidetes bacterium]|nr:hypothetical protein [Bacteroidota bacterium]